MVTQEFRCLLYFDGIYGALKICWGKETKNVEDSFLRSEVIHFTSFHYLQLIHSTNLTIMESRMYMESYRALGPFHNLCHTGSLITTNAIVFNKISHRQ